MLCLRDIVKALFKYQKNEAFIRDKIFVLNTSLM